MKQAKITREDEDRIKIGIPEIGYVILTNTTPESEFSEDISEEEMEELGLDYQDFIGKIEYIYINPKSRGEGNAKLLMQKAIKYAEKKGMTPIYLNASPIQAEKGLGLNDLTKFYEKFGFETFKRQGQNNLMIRINKTNLEEVGTMKLTKILEEVITEIGDASKQPYGPIDTITDDEAERQYGFETESGTIYEVKIETIDDGPWNPVIARVNFGIVGEEGDVDYYAQTGENDIYRIMSTIVAIVKKDLKSNHADIIEFSPSKREGDKDKDPMSNVRTQLYSRYIKAQFPNAEVTRTLYGDIQVILNK